jgi:Zn-dependent protease with chaperone function
MGWLLSLLCLLIAGGIGVVLSSVVTPLLLLVGGGLLHGVAALNLFPDMARAGAHGLGTWAALQSKHFDAFADSLDHIGGVADFGVTVAPLLNLAPVAIPALLAACLVWLALRRIAWRDEGGDMIARLHARAPDRSDPEERQLVNIVAEIAIAAGMPTPGLLLIDSPEINAAAVGRYGANAHVLITRGLLDRLDRDETSGIVAHLIASIGAGDIRLSHGILAVFQTFGFFVTFLDLPFRWSAWRALGGLLLVATGLRRQPEAVAQTLEAVERGLNADAMPDIDRVWSIIPYPRVRKILLVPWLPLILISVILRLVLFLWTALFLGPPLALMWRNRRFAADAMAVQLTRNPNGLASALTRISGSSIPPGGQGREYAFVHGPASSRKGGFADRRTVTLSLHPALIKRLQRLRELGATSIGPRRLMPIRFDLIARFPGRTLLVAFLLALLLPLGATLVVMVGFLTVLVMTLGLAAGLTIAAGVLG